MERLVFSIRGAYNMKTGEIMRKRMIVFLAVILPGIAVWSHWSVPGGMAEVYGAEIRDCSKSAHGAKSYSSVFGAGKENIVDWESTSEEIGEQGFDFPIELEEPETGTPERFEDPIAADPISGFAALSDHEAVVKNYSELKTALSEDNGITTVYFGDDITMQAKGIRINPNKTNITIDGINPLDRGQTRPHMLTDYSSASFYDTIYIDAAGTETLLVRDLTITGKNYYGPFSIYNSSALEGIIVTYERVNYNGPQLIYHRWGTAHIVNCAVKIHGGNGGSESQEFSEAKHLVFEGKSTIDTATIAHSIFWHPAGGTFKIADDSSIILASPNTSDAKGAFYASGTAYNVDITIGRRAVLDMTISSILSSGVYANLSSLTVQESGAFLLTTTKTAFAPVLRMGGDLTIEKDAEFNISAYGGSPTYTILRQEIGDITVEKGAAFHITADNANWSLLNLFGREFICNDPSSILLYNANRNIRATNSAGQIYVNAQQINYWNMVSAGGIDEPPLYKWEKGDKTNLVLDGMLAHGDRGNFTSISSNYASGDPPGAAPSAENFNMADARVLAFGRLELTVTETTAASTAISGVTNPGATVRASFSQQGINYTLPDVTADSQGVFRIPLNVTLSESAVVTIKCNWQYLTATAESIVSGDGRLEFFVPDSMDFLTTEITSTTQIVKRVHVGWEITVSDTRRGSGGWNIYARLDSEMTPNSADRPVLNRALIFVDEFGNTTVMSTDTDILILKHSSVGEEVFSIVWDDNKGVLLAVKPGVAFSDTLYTASISWTLVDAP